MNKKSDSNRWFIVNKNTLNVRTTKATRAAARTAKRGTEYIYDSVNGVAIR